MIEKPEALKGIVLLFEDWLNQYEYEPKLVSFRTKSEYGLTKSERIRADEEEMIERRIILEFYRQSFDPILMISTYFDNFIGKINSISPPTTLAQFISDALRSGVSLTWK